MDQSLEVLRDSFHSITFLGFKNVKINVFYEKNIFGCILLRTGPGDLKNTKHLKFDIWQIFKAFFKKWKEKSHFPRILKIVSSTR